jgi:hypothetical protein
MRSAIDAFSAIRRCMSLRFSLRFSVVTALAVLGVVVASSAGAAPQRVVDHDFVGAERCRACHAKEYDVMARGPHARAFDVLGTKDRADPRCLACHTLVPDDLSSSLLGVQCESCHGPGRHYSIDYVMRDAELAKLLSLAKVDDKTCLRCHTESSPSLNPFVVADKIALIKHWADAPAPPVAPSAAPPK